MTSLFQFTLPTDAQLDKLIDKQQWVFGGSMRHVFYMF